MAIKEAAERKYFWIIDYFLDGKYLKWEEVLGTFPTLTKGKKIAVGLDNGKEVTGTIIETKFVSDDEQQVYLSSCRKLSSCRYCLTYSDHHLR